MLLAEQIDQFGYLVRETDDAIGEGLELRLGEGMRHKGERFYTNEYCMMQCDTVFVCETAEMERSFHDSKASANPRRRFGI
jgi:hypothetical protein